MAENIGQWNEPETPYGLKDGQCLEPNPSGNTVYPFNKVYESESGHVVEIDDTPGSERIHVFHRTGSFLEIHPNGDRVDKVVRDRYEHTLRDKSVHVDGFHDITIDKGLKILVNKDELETSENSAVNFDVHVGKNANVNLFVERGNCNVRLMDGDANVHLDKGSINVRQDEGNYNHYVGGDYNLEVKGHCHTVIGEDQVTEIGGNRDCRVDGKFDNLEVVSGYKETKIGSNFNLEVLGGYSEKITKDHHKKISGDCVVSIDGNKSEKILKDLTLESNSFDGTHNSDAKFTVFGSYDLSVSNEIKLFSGSSLDIFSGGQANITSSNFGILSSGNLAITSSGTMGLKGSSIYQTGSQIHLNGPSGPSASSASKASQAKKVSKTPLYIVGQGASWRKTVSGKNDIETLGLESAKLQQQKLALQGANTKILALQDQTKTLQDKVNVANMGAFREADYSEDLVGITSDTKGLLDNTGSVFGEVRSSYDGIGSSLSTVGQVQSGLSAGVLDPVDGITDGITGAFGSIGSVIGAISVGIGQAIDSIVDVVCAIANAIGAIIGKIVEEIGKVLGAILGAIGSILGKIGEVIGKLIDMIGKIVDAIGSIIAKILNAAGKIIGAVVNGIGDLLANLFKGLGEISCEN